MSSRAKSSKLMRALRQLVPHATLSVIDERPWYSITFSGVQTCIALTLTVEHHSDFVAHFKRELPETEFDLKGQLVADIAVTAETNSENRICLRIDALLLDV